MKDTYRHKGLRKKLVQALRRKGIKDKRVLEAINALPRHFFLDRAFEEWAYHDKAFPIGNEQTISQPYTVAYMTALLDVQKREKVMEIGTGSGYQAAILALLGARVYTVERQQTLYRQAQKLLRELGFGNVRCFYRDGHRGLPEYAPFDKIIVTAGGHAVPLPLLEQLKVGGCLVIPIGEQVQQMHRITRRSKGEYEEEKLGSFKFVPFQKGTRES